MKLVFLLTALAISCSGPKYDELPLYETGLVRPDNWRVGADFEKVAIPTALPDSFEFKNLPPIKHQGNCGSCWAFSVTAVLEFLSLGLSGDYKDLAEQNLVSRCSNSGSCGGGYFSAFNYLKSEGLPLESEDPYREANSSCRQTNPPKIKIARWAYVGESNREPTTEEIKAALMTYGILSVTVAGSGAIQRHRGAATFTACDSNRVNHMTNIVGWKTENGQTVWRMRNSWGTGHADKGYLNILAEKNGRKCNAIGETTAFAVINFAKNN